MDERIVDTIKNRLNKAMLIRGLRQMDLVEKTGISKGSISQYVTGAAEPKNDRIYQLAKVLDVSEAWLIGFDVPMERTNTNIVVEYNSPEPDAMDRRLLAYFHGMSDANKFELLAKLAREAEKK